MGKSRSKKRFQKDASSLMSSDHILPPVFPLHLSRPPRGSFLTDTPPYQESFREALKGPYIGFVVDDEATLLSSQSNNNHTTNEGVREDIVQASLERLFQRNVFRTDVTQPFGLGTKCAKTYVTRCLFGTEGSTYKYLGLRMFAHPYTINDRSNTDNINDATMTIRKLGSCLTNRTKTHLKSLTLTRRQRHANYITKGRPDFDICLINRMEANSDLKPFTLDEGVVNNNSTQCSDNNSKINNNLNNRRNVCDDNNRIKTSVSWHADSSLENFSTIAVYQTIIPSSEKYGRSKGHNDDDKSRRKQQTSVVDNTDGEDEGKWLVGLKVSHYSEGPEASQHRREANTDTDRSLVEKETPCIAVNLPSGSAYYLLDDFNHHHQHTVLTEGTNTTVRYSCTYRLLRDSHNIQDWIHRGKTAISQFHKKGPKIWRSEQLLLTEIESEWIRQFYIQGRGHYQLLWDSYWKEPMQELLKIWKILEKRTEQTVMLLRGAAEGRCMKTEERISHKPTKAERKARDRRKKHLLTIQELLSRFSATSNVTEEIAFKELYQPFAMLLEERNSMRNKWEKREKDHVFYELPSDYRPMEVPLDFSDALPKMLKEVAGKLLQLGKAYQSGDAQHLPSWGKGDENNFPPVVGQTPVDDHAKSTWSGWNIPGRTFGLELQHPWAAAIADGRKMIETRLYELPPSLIGKKIMILESCSGKTGVSSLSNHVKFEGTKAIKVIGWVSFKCVKTYTTKSSFLEDESRHLVTSGSGYGWKDGYTKKIYGWTVEETHRFDVSSNQRENIYVSGVRRYRSLFELLTENKDACTTSNEKKLHKKNRNRRSNDNGTKKKKRRRY